MPSMSSGRERRRRIGDLIGFDELKIEFYIVLKAGINDQFYENFARNTFDLRTSPQLSGEFHRFCPRRERSFRSGLLSFRAWTPSPSCI
jgi:hypothetical protein